MILHMDDVHGYQDYLKDIPAAPAFHCLAINPKRLHPERRTVSFHSQDFVTPLKNYVNRISVPEWEK